MRRFLIDTDTASDDAVAMCMALRQPDIDVVDAPHVDPILVDEEHISSGSVDPERPLVLTLIPTFSPSLPLADECIAEACANPYGR